MLSFKTSVSCGVEGGLGGFLLTLTMKYKSYSYLSTPLSYLLSIVFTYNLCTLCIHLPTHQQYKSTFHLLSIIYQSMDQYIIYPSI